VRIKKSTGTLLIIISLSIYISGLLIASRYVNLLFRVITASSYAFNLLGMIVFVYKPLKPHMPLPEGSVVAIVPSYNEDPQILKQCIESLLHQTVPVRTVYVVDDGSDPPVEHYPDERVVTIHMPKNSGKRSAQAEVIRTLDSKETPFILTVDSDSINDPDALEHMLRQMSDTDVKACTGSILANNYDKNLLTKIQEFNYGTSISLQRNSRRLFGVLESTSGASSLYRTEIIQFHLEDYLEHEKRYPYGDDRRLCLYSMMEGKVIYVPEAVVYTNVPESFSTLWRQRVRWASSHWSALPYTIVNLTFKGYFFPLQNLFLSLFYPICLASIIVYYTLSGSGGIWLFYIAFIFAMAYSNSLFYVVSRPNHSFLRKAVDWLTIVPLYAIWLRLFTMPAKYVAAYRVIANKSDWGTRKGSILTKETAKKKPVA